MADSRPSYINDSAIKLHLRTVGAGGEGRKGHSMAIYGQAPLLFGASVLACFFLTSCSLEDFFCIFSNHPPEIQGFSLRNSRFVQNQSNIVYVSFSDQEGNEQKIALEATFASQSVLHVFEVLTEEEKLLGKRAVTVYPQHIGDLRLRATVYDSCGASQTKDGTFPVTQS